ncbi:MAG: biotin--[acetyl-CoA-carboxylase] ligase [Sulfobacillus thermosulfidooxidans]|nr:MAG: biotin--[acetyl-CoA-carboxylase] ligase [Sulfobacillus thermosulfidooxidans]
MKSKEPRWLGADLTQLARVGSTNQVLRERMRRQHVPEGAVVLAREQTAGRGRLGRVWWSPPNQGLYVSVLLYPPRTRQGGILSLLAGVALTDAVEQATGMTPGLKWPNDAVMGGKKYAGILVEGGTEPQPWAIVGMGINVLGTVPEDFPHATTLSQELGKDVDIEGLWRHLAKALEQRYEQWLEDGNAPIIAQWKTVSVTLGYAVEVRTPSGLITGIAEDVSDDGTLWIRQGSDRVPVMSGEVSLRLANGAYAPRT